MKLLFDENIPLTTLHQLRDANYDVLHINEYQSGIPDDAVLDLANSESRIIITFDSDFGDLIFRQKKVLTTGIIFLRLAQFMPHEPGNILITLFKNPSINFQNKLSVVTKEGIRQKIITY